MMSMGRAAVVLAFLCQLGCVLYDRHVVLVGPATADNGLAAAGACVPGRPVVTVAFVDGRAQRGPVGAVRNGFYMAMSDVVTSDDLGVWVTRAVSDGLRRTGTCVANVRWQPAPSADARRLDLSGGITHAWCDAYFTYWADVTLDVSIAGPSGRSIRKTYVGHGAGGVNATASEKSFAEVLNLALADAVSQIVRDANSMALPAQPLPLASRGVELGVVAKDAVLVEGDPARGGQVGGDGRRGGDALAKRDQPREPSRHP